MRALFLTAALVALAACNADPSADTPTNADTNAAAPVTNAAAPVDHSGAIDMSPIDAAGAKTLMHERHEGMERVGKLMKGLARDTKADPLDMAAIAPAAAEMADLSGKAMGWFRAGTGPDVGKTGSKPEIWQKPDDFKAKLGEWHNAAMAFDAAAKSGDAAATKAAFGNLGKSCKACHDSYRSKEEH